MASVPSVFISSIQRDFESFRDVACDALLSAGCHPVMAENAGAGTRSPQAELLARVLESDALLLLVGLRYGERGASGMSPTEEEFRTAVSNGIPVYFLVLDGERDADQEVFLAELTHGWEDGRLYDRFADVPSLQLAVARIARHLRASDVGGAHGAELKESAVRRIGELLASALDRPDFASQPHLAVCVSPVRSFELLSPIVLNDTSTPDTIIGLARRAGLAPNSVALAGLVRSSGVRVEEPNGSRGFVSFLASDGAVLTRLPVTDRSGGTLSFMGIAPSLVDSALSSSFQFVVDVWATFHARPVQSLLIAAGLSNTSNSVWGVPAGNSVSMSSSLANTIIVPATPLEASQDDLADQPLRRRISAFFEREFRDADALTSA